MKRYLIVEATNGNIKDLAMICEGYKGLKFLGELKGQHLIVEPIDKKDGVKTHLLLRP